MRLTNYNKYNKHKHLPFNIFTFAFFSTYIFLKEENEGLMESIRQLTYVVQTLNKSKSSHIRIPSLINY